MVSALRLICALCLVVCSPGAFAFDWVYPETQTVFTCTGYGSGANSSAQGDSGPGACAQLMAQQPSNSTVGTEFYTWSFSQVSCTPSNAIPNHGSCQYNAHYTCRYVGRTDSCGAGDIGVSLAYTGVTDTGCPPPAVKVPGTPLTCTCPSSWMPRADRKKCVQYTCPPSGSYTAITQPDQKVANAGDTICTGGCGYKPSSWKVGQDGQIWATWPFKSTGAFCGGDLAGTPPVDSGEKNSKNPAPVPCGQNQCPGQVNGATICVPCKGQQEQGPSTSASAPGDGASSPGSSTTSSTQTTCDGVSCTTTTTTRDGSGNTTGQTSTQQPQESFCRQNPESSLCKQSSFGGACAATTCQGDAVQCAIAADQYRRNCQWFDDPKGPALQQAGEATMTGEAHPGDHPYTTATQQSVSFQSTIDQTDRLGGGCPVDASFSVAGHTMSVPFSRACEPLQMLGQLLVGLTALACIFIVFRG